MDYIQLTKENIEKEHICCAISNNRDVQVSSKKNWLADRFDDGLVFIKSVQRGKCFIEYIPAENAWVPIAADNYMYINCLWVSGSLKGNGYASDLFHRQRKNHFLQIRSFWPIRALAFATRQTTVFSFGLYHLKTAKSQD